MLQLNPNCNAACVELAIARQLWESGEGEETGDASSKDKFPLPDEDKLEINSHSDSSDYGHKGNDTPC